MKLLASQAWFIFLVILALALIPAASFVWAQPGLIKFAAVGDIECKDAKNIAAKIKLANVNRTLILGDMGYQAEGGDCIRNAFIGTNAKPTVGNHDDTNDVRDVWDITHDIQTYKTGNVRFLSLNTEMSADAQKSRVQGLLNKYKNDPSVTWIIPFEHKPFVTNPSAHHKESEAKNFRSTFIPMFLDNGKVKLVLQGHNHGYQQCDTNGILFLTAGTGGRNPYPWGSTMDDNCKYNISGTDGFLIASVTSSEIVGMFKDLNNNQYDNTKFEISK